MIDKQLNDFRIQWDPKKQIYLNSISKISFKNNMGG